MKTQMYDVMSKVLENLSRHEGPSPTLSEIARKAGYSESHFQKAFQEWVGVSPKNYLHSLQLFRAKSLIAGRKSLLDVSLEIGLSSPSRLHDLFLKIEKMTPGEFQKGTARIFWSLAQTPLGEAVFCATDRGLCRLHFLERGSKSEVRDFLEAHFPSQEKIEDPSRLRPYVEEMELRFRGEVSRPLSVVLAGTELQLKVWEALLAIPGGQVTTYGDIAKKVNNPKASRAVGSAIGKNPLAVLIPCHRVIQKQGWLGGYRWGLARKQLLLAGELSRNKDD
jgi:AraC family transcriptional regulator of adaptative response/methylated-DNA-[protein]-cysteine methyltransferase